MSQEQTSDIPSPTKERSKSIQAIDREAVHRICSGQVVLNLATAVKELVENSLDAGATSIEIRLREYGSELVEVVDNGCGVEEENFEGLTLKHHTSKLREFSDLLGVETFGFRGEALSSLCALSEMTVITRHSSSGSGTKLTYDSRGFIVSRTPCARQIGTTVTLGNLFSPLPVRQKEFLRNLRREFVKMSQLLHAYCLISTGVKILCSNQTKKGGKTVVLSTQGSSTFKGNVMCIFGAKQANNLLDIEMQAPEANLLKEIGLSSSTETSTGFQLEGCISSCAHGQGRSSTDRQFYFINNRPCDSSKVSKVVNEVYHQFNLHQFPFVFLNIKTPRDSVDVNVTPDKRQIFLDNEKLLIATIKASLLKLYEKIPNTYEVQNISIGSSKSNVTLLNARPSNSAPSSSPNTSVSQKSTNFSSLLKNFSHSMSKYNSQHDSEFTKRDVSGTTARGVKRTLSSENYDKEGRKQLCLSSFILPKKIDVSESLPHDKDSSVSVNREENIQYAQHSVDKTNDVTTNIKEGNGVIDGMVKDSDTISNNPPNKGFDKSLELNKIQEPAVYTCDTVPHNSIKNSSHEMTELTEEKCSEPDISCVEENFNNIDSEKWDSSNQQNYCPSSTMVYEGKRDEVVTRRKTVTLNVALEKLQKYYRKKSSNEEENRNIVIAGPRIRFYAEIDPSKNKNAEQELKKEISKEMFSKMEIIGQFNLGFIITKLGHDLFIVDQHATDEKFNFEMLQSHTSLKNQNLVIPEALELTAVNESILMDNLDIFLKNGFNFVIDEGGEPTKRIRLSAKPISHNWEFGKEDIDELLFMLQDSPHTMCRPSRVRAMFASRACRKSVMIGTALSKSTMRQLVDHMGEIEQPWNCPHGRPTMRHLVNLELVRKRK